ncbi:hypothetical protein JTB14_028856 [Gonioctena quinquepunctata]|nr:hypothetical protein JTB14_028856 [Gonioctena quinquepunctata]
MCFDNQKNVGAIWQENCELTYFYEGNVTHWTISKNPLIQFIEFKADNKYYSLQLLQTETKCENIEWYHTDHDNIYAYEISTKRSPIRLQTSLDKRLRFNSQSLFVSHYEKKEQIIQEIYQVKILVMTTIVLFLLWVIIKSVRLLKNCWGIWRTNYYHQPIVRKCVKISEPCNNAYDYILDYVKGPE